MVVTAVIALWTNHCISSKPGMMMNHLLQKVGLKWIPDKLWNFMS